MGQTGKAGTRSAGQGSWAGVGGVLLGLGRQRRGRGIGRIGTLLAGAAVAGCWGGQGVSRRVLGSWAAVCRGAQCQAARVTTSIKQPRRLASGQARRRRPLAWRHLVPKGGGQGAGSASARAGKVPRAGAPACSPAPCRIHLTASVGPRETRLWLFLASPKGHRESAARPPAPGTLLSSRVPRIDSCRRSAPERLRWAETVQPSRERSHRRGSPRSPAAPRLSYPDRSKWRGRSGGGGFRCPPPFLRPTASLPPPPPVRTGLAGDADGAAPSLGRKIEPR